jgi:hypothetical protein
MIKSHLYTNKAETFLYPDRDETAHPICTLQAGIWLGELERIEGWIRVLGIEGEGWVKATDVEYRSPFNLHVHWTPGKPITYKSTAA